MFVYVEHQQWDGDNDDPKAYGPFDSKKEAMAAATTAAKKIVKYYDDEYGGGVEIERGSNSISVVDEETYGVTFYVQELNKG